MLSALDLQWIHFFSFVVGMAADWVLPWMLIGLAFAAARGARWVIGHWSGAERGAERGRGGARSGGPPPVARSGRAHGWSNTVIPPRVLDSDQIPGAYPCPGYRPPITHAPREVPLSPEESRKLFDEINGDRGLV